MKSRFLAQGSEWKIKNKKKGKSKSKGKGKGKGTGVRHGNWGQAGGVNPWSETRSLGEIGIMSRIT